MNGVVAVEQQRSIAEVQAAVIMARQFPRDQVQAINRIRLACQRPALAEVAMYTYARGGADVTGPSIRMAESIAQMWGNIKFGIVELSQANGESTVKAYAWDLETNVQQEKVFQVKHERHTRQGSKRLTDPRDIYELAANNGARRLRACILGIIPGDVVESAVSECDNTLRTTVQVTPERVKAMLEMFEGFGVTKATVEKRIQRPVENITPAIFVNLGKIANSLRDGISKATDWFEVATAAPNSTVTPPTSVRLTKSQMEQAKTEIENAIATHEMVLEKYPNLNAEQVEEIKSWTFNAAAA